VRPYQPEKSRSVVPKKGERGRRDEPSSPEEREVGWDTRGGIYLCRWIQGCGERDRWLEEKETEVSKRKRDV